MLAFFVVTQKSCDGKDGLVEIEIFGKLHPINQAFEEWMFA